MTEVHQLSLTKKLQKTEAGEQAFESSALTPLLPSHRQEHDESLSPSQPPQKGLILFRSLFVLSGLSTASWGRFGVIYYNQVKHLKPQQIGILQAVVHSAGFLSVPIWGYLADMIQSRKRVYLLCNVMSTLSLLMLPFQFVDTFGKILICIFINATFRCSAVLDALALDFLGENHRGMYGTIRLYIPLAFGLGASAMGRMTDEYGFAWNFGCFAFLMTLLVVLTASGLPVRSESEQGTYNRIHSRTAEESQESTGDDNGNGLDLNTLARVLFRLPILFWLFEVAIIGTGLVLADSFIFVFLQNELQASTTLCGFSVGIQVLFEMPIFYCSAYLLRTLGHDVLFLIAMLAYSIRVFGFSLLSPEILYLVYVLEALHGVTFASMWIASIDFSAAVAPKEWSTTVQSILTLTHTCLGGGLGPILGGWLMEHYGPRKMFRGAASMLFALSLVHIIVWRVCKRGHDDFLRSKEASKS